MPKPDNQSPNTKTMPGTETQPETKPEANHSWSAPLPKDAPAIWRYDWSKNTKYYGKTLAGHDNTQRMYSVIMEYQAIKQKGNFTSEKNYAFYALAKAMELLRLNDGQPADKLFPEEKRIPEVFLTKTEEVWSVLSILRKNVVNGQTLEVGPYEVIHAVEELRQMQTKSQSEEQKEDKAAKEAEEKKKQEEEAAKEAEEKKKQEEEAAKEEEEKKQQKKFGLAEELNKKQAAEKERIEQKEVFTEEAVKKEDKKKEDEKKEDVKEEAVKKEDEKKEDVKEERAEKEDKKEKDVKKEAEEKDEVVKQDKPEAENIIHNDNKPKNRLDFAPEAEEVERKQVAGQHRKHQEKDILDDAIESFDIASRRFLWGGSGHQTEFEAIQSAIRSYKNANENNKRILTQDLYKACRIYLDKHTDNGQRQMDIGGQKQAGGRLRKQAVINILRILDEKSASVKEEYNNPYQCVQGQYELYCDDKRIPAIKLDYEALEGSLAKETCKAVRNSKLPIHEKAYKELQLATEAFRTKKTEEEQRRAAEQKKRELQNQPDQKKQPNKGKQPKK